MMDGDCIKWHPIHWDETTYRFAGELPDVPECDGFITVLVSHENKYERTSEYRTQIATDIFFPETHAHPAYFDKYFNGAITAWAYIPQPYKRRIHTICNGFTDVLDKRYDAYLSDDRLYHSKW